MKTAWIMTFFSFLFFVGLLAGCGDFDRREKDKLEAEKQAERDWNGPCRDQSTLLATTAGSPSTFICSNKQHRMQVQIATHPSNEEAAALVFCKCEAPSEATKPMNSIGNK